jgi:hypothetical protein
LAAFDPCLISKIIRDTFPVKLMQDKTFVDLLWLYHVVSGIALDLINHEVVVPGTIKRSFFFDWIIIRSIIHRLKI